MGEVRFRLTPLIVPSFNVVADPTAAVTVIVVTAEMLPNFAVTLALPTVRPVARPELLTVATLVFDEVQTTPAFRACDVPSE